MVVDDGDEGLALVDVGRLNYHVDVVRDEALPATEMGVAHERCEASAAVATVGDRVGAEPEGTCLRSRDVRLALRCAPAGTGTAAAVGLVKLGSNGVRCGLATAVGLEVSVSEENPPQTRRLFLTAAAVAALFSAYSELIQALRISDLAIAVMDGQTLSVESFLASHALDSLAGTVVVENERVKALRATVVDAGAS